METLRMSDKGYRILTLEQHDMWNNAVGSLSQLHDISFKNQYFALYKGIDGEPETFYYKNNDKVFLLSYIKRAIPGSEYYDFETAYGYGGPLSNSNEAGFLKEAWYSFYKYCEDKGIIGGFIRFNPIIHNNRIADSEYIDVVKECIVVILNLDKKNNEQIWSDYSRDNRNKIRLAKKNKVIVYKNNDIETLSIFKQLYYQTMDRLGVDKFYYFDDVFFKNIDRYLKDEYMVFIAYFDERPVGSSLVLYTDNILNYFLSATAEEGRRLGVANLLRHESIEFCRQKGIGFINFGGGKTSDKNDSLLRFKMKFSKETGNFYIGKFLVNQEAYKKLCGEWRKNSSPEKIIKYDKRFLKYRN